MKLLTVFLLAICATSTAQTIKTLGYNITNGQVSYTGTNPLTFTNALSFGTNAAATRNNLSLGAAWLTNTNLADFRVAIGLGESSTVVFSNVEVSRTVEFDTLFLPSSTNQTRIQFEEPAIAKTFVRNLTGSTNTNHPFSGSVDIVDGNLDVHNLVISNGIIVSWQAP